MEKGKQLWRPSLTLEGKLRSKITISSEACHMSDAASDASSSSEDQFAFSPAHTPSHEKPPHRPPSNLRGESYFGDGVMGTIREGYFCAKDLDTRTDSSTNISESGDTPLLGLNSQTKPIDIGSPFLRKLNSDSVPSYTPSAPLSARGDIPGGYFPYHENPESRVWVPHPFKQDAAMARQSSLHRAYESSTFASVTVRPSAAVSEPAEFPFPEQRPAAEVTHTPVSSYLPNGAHSNVALPQGKYYPTNYENRRGKSSVQRPAGSSKLGPAIAKSEPQVTKVRREHHAQSNGHNRSGSDAQRKHLQYRRDMVAQTAMAASAVISKSTTSGNLHLAAAILKSHKPLSPRLAPLGSPGPVTPMSLEGDMGYLTLGREMTGADAEKQAAEVARAIRAERRRHRRNDSCSSAAELGALSI